MIEKTIENIVRLAHSKISQWKWTRGSIPLHGRLKVLLESLFSKTRFTDPRMELDQDITTTTWSLSDCVQEQRVAAPGGVARRSLPMHHVLQVLTHRQSTFLIQSSPQGSPSEQRLKGNWLPYRLHMSLEHRFHIFRDGEPGPKYFVNTFILLLVHNISVES
jgi:hypothetical protein